MPAEALLDTEIAAGLADGREWALGRAEPDARVRLASLQLLDTRNAGSYRWQVYCAIATRYPDSHDCETFWDFVSGVPAPSDPYVLAFTTAAVAAFNDAEGISLAAPTPVFRHSA